MELFNFYTAYTQLLELYGIELTPDSFETMGMIGWGKIGNRMMITKSETLDIHNYIVELPCEADELEAVTDNTSDYQSTSSTKDHWNTHNELYTEQYIEMTTINKGHLYTPGRFVKYELIGPRAIKVDRKSGSVNVMYKTVITDEQDLPMLNQKEVDAIAAYCAYADTFKKGLMSRNGDMVNLSQSLEQRWLKACDHARTPMSMSQNDFDAIGNIQKSWDRKTYGKSFKPVR